MLERKHEIDRNQYQAINGDNLKAVDHITNQLCRVIDGDFDISVRTDSNEETIQRLGLLVNFVLDAARRSVAKETAVQEELKHQSDVLELTVRTLQNSEAISREIVDNVGDAIITIDENKTVVTCNQAAQKIFSTSDGEIRWQEIDRFVPCMGAKESDGDDQAELLNSFCGRFSEVTGINENGVEIPLELYVNRIKVGDKVGYVALMRDLTEQKLSEKKLKENTDKIVKLSREAGKAEIATGVLHNVGNVLNSVNVALSLATDYAKRIDIDSYEKVMDLLDKNIDNLGYFLTEDKKGKLIPGFLRDLSAECKSVQTSLLDELSTLDKSIGRIKDIVQVQQEHARSMGVSAVVKLADVLDESIFIALGTEIEHEIEIEKEYLQGVEVNVDQDKLAHILVNLISNARDSIREFRPERAVIKIQIVQNEKQMVAIMISDNGVGISADKMTQIFSFGFTTKRKGHGFGLHASSLAAKELGGDLLVSSAGVGCGATFTLNIPLNT